MMRHLRLEHRFVKHIPEKLEPSVLYVSVEYGSAAHSCCCGCGEEVVTPITPTDWKITYDGESISLWPSIGNWNLPCRSHYIIERGRVNEALPWTNEQIAAERQRDQAAKARYYGTPFPAQPTTLSPPVPAPEKKVIGRWGRFTQWILNFFLYR